MSKCLIIPKEAVKKILFENSENYCVKSSEYWSNDHVFWNEENINVQRKLTKEEHGYEVISGKGKITGQLLGGCIDVIPMLLETEIWLKADDWKDKILLIETSEEKHLLYKTLLSTPP